MTNKDVYFIIIKFYRAYIQRRCNDTRVSVASGDPSTEVHRLR